mgnify:FL=1
MAEKLESLLRGIPWYLVLKSASFGVGWLVLPFWLFLILAAYLYLLPFFRPLKMALAFLILIFLVLESPHAIWMAVLYSVLFYLILGIKDLVFIERRPYYEMLILLITFIVFIGFFNIFEERGGYSAYISALLVSLIFFFLTRGFLDNDGGIYARDIAFVRRRDVCVAVLSLLIWQMFAVLMFLPVNFLYQAAILFLFTTVGLEMVSDYLENSLTNRRILFDFSVFIVFLVVILGLIPWSP